MLGEKNFFGSNSGKVHMQRRDLITGVTAAGLSSILGADRWKCPSDELSETLGPVRAFEPVIGDGIWIWREPPKTERGYLEPRSYDVSIGVEMTAVGSAAQAMATTPVPAVFPEQSVEEVSIDTEGCEAVIRPLNPSSSQLLVKAMLAPGQTAYAVARMKVTIYKQYHGFSEDFFPASQAVPKEIKSIGLGDSPGIQTTTPSVRRLASDISQSDTHPWTKAQSFVQWIRKNIRPRYGIYTSVMAAIEDRVGDCEEMSALFVAFCRASGIPARLVWVPNHNWAEFYLQTNDGVGYWIPVHPACYNWFGWTGVHELILQKGDRVRLPETGGTARLVPDWLRSNGRIQKKFTAQMQPLPAKENADPGPGMREKDPKTGEWKIVAKHPLDKFARR